MAPKKPDPDDSGWLKQLLLGVGALIVVAGLVGGVIAVVLVKAVDVSGLGEAADPSPSADPDIPVVVSPTPSPTGSTPARSPNASAPQAQQATPTKATSTGKPSAKPSDKATDKKKDKKEKKSKKLTLSAHPTKASTWDRVTLVGRFPGHDGATLQVQRNVGSGWTKFPVTAQVHGGHYDTYVQSGRTGVNKFRMVAVGSGKTSNVVTVKIR